MIEKAEHVVKYICTQFAIPVIWLNQKILYINLTVIKGFSTESKRAIKYPNLSAQRAIPQNEEMPIPIAPKTVHSDEFSMSPRLPSTQEEIKEMQLRTYHF